MRSTVSLKFKKSHQLMNVQQAFSYHESKSKQLMIITKEKKVVNIPETFKFFSPVLTKILAPQTLNQETVIVVPDISITAIIKLHELVLSGQINDVIQSNYEGRCNDIISEIIDVAKLFDIKINPTAILSGNKECVGSDADTSESEYCEIPTPPLNPNCLEKQVKDLVKEEVKFQLVDCKDEHDVDNNENVVSDCTAFESSNSNTDGNHYNNSYNFNIGDNSSLAGGIVRSSKDLVTAVKSVQDVEFKTEIEEMIEPVQSVSCSDVGNDHDVSTSHFDVDTVSLNRFDLKLNRVTTVQKIELSCKSCRYQTKSKSKLKNHVQTLHQDMQFFCSICKFQTKSKKYLKRHVNARHGNVVYSCKSCSYQSKRMDMLKRHTLAEHENIRYFCHSCSYETKFKPQLKKHVQAEHEGVRFSCESCSYQAKHKKNLKEHVRAKHEGVRYSCESCSFQSKYRHNLREHLKVEHEGIKYSCEQCNYQCKWKNEVNLHVRRVHMNDLSCIDKQ